MKNYVTSLLTKTSELIFPPTPTCVFCGKELQAGEVCEACAKENAPYQLTEPVQYLEFACYSPFSYQGKIPGLIQRFKFEDARYLSAYMARQMTTHIKQDRYDVITCVPLHKSRIRFRGYNQAEVLASALADECELPFMHTLRRVKKTAPQTSLGREARQHNVKNAFAVDEAADIAGKRILLIDDVVTVGATMSACMKVLLDNGAKSVMGASFAATLA